MELEVHQDAGDMSVLETSATFYINAEKKWVPGMLYIAPKGIDFEVNENIRSSCNLSLISFSYDEISSVQKENSSFLFGAVTVMAGKEKYWFSSLPNRENVFKMIEHFWREKLITQKLHRQKKKYTKGEETSLGKELLRIACDSQNSLNSSASHLLEQGKILDEAELLAEELHGELVTSNKALAQLESWCFSWSLPSVGIRNMVVPERAKAWEYSVIYTIDKDKPDPRLQNGILKITEGDISIMDEKGNTMHHFQRKELSNILLTSPWELNLQQRKIGEKDVNVQITTAQLILALRPIQKFYSQHLSLEDPVEVKQTKSKIRPLLKYQRKVLDITATALKTEDVASSSATALMQDQVSTEVISQEEVEELRQVLSGMKEVALGITQEQSDQMDKIERLLMAVDKAEGTIQDDIRRIKKLM